MRGIPGFSGEESLTVARGVYRGRVAALLTGGVRPAQGIDDIGDCYLACARLHSFCTSSGGIGCDVGYDRCTEGCDELFTEIIQS